MAEDVAKVIKKISGEDPDPSWLERRLNAIAAMGDDIVELTFTTLANPLAGLGLVVKKLLALLSTYLSRTWPAPSPQSSPAEFMTLITMLPGRNLKSG